VQHPFIVYDNCHRSPSILIRPPCFSNRVRAADVPDFPALDAHLAETQERVRKRFVSILGSAP
jgi:hypothetical protein